MKIYLPYFFCYLTWELLVNLKSLTQNVCCAFLRLMCMLLTSGILSLWLFVVETIEALNVKRYILVVGLVCSVKRSLRSSCYWYWTLNVFRIAALFTLYCCIHKYCNKMAVEELTDFGQWKWGEEGTWCGVVFFSFTTIRPCPRSFILHIMRACFILLIGYWPPQWGSRKVNL